jgi:hypothetical protein
MWRGSAGSAGFPSEVGDGGQKEESNKEKEETSSLEDNLEALGYKNKKRRELDSIFTEAILLNTFFHYHCFLMFLWRGLLLNRPTF